MTLNQIAKYIRKAIGVLNPTNPKEERIISALLEKLKDHSKWEREDSQTIKHKEFNIEVWQRYISCPDGIRIPFRWRSHIQEHINIVLKNARNDKLDFIHDVISGKYVYQIYEKEGDREWLKENATSDQYLIKQYWIYILNKELAMGFKLALR